MRSEGLPSTFRMAEAPSLNFRETFVRPVDLPLTSVNFPCSQESFDQLPSTLGAAGRLSLKFRQLKMQPGDLP